MKWIGNAASLLLIAKPSLVRELKWWVTCFPRLLVLRSISFMKSKLIVVVLVLTSILFHQIGTIKPSINPSHSVPWYESGLVVSSSASPYPADSAITLDVFATQIKALTRLFGKFKERGAQLCSRILRCWLTDRFSQPSFSAAAETEPAHDMSENRFKL